MSTPETMRFTPIDLMITPTIKPGVVTVYPYVPKTYPYLRPELYPAVEKPVEKPPIVVMPPPAAEVNWVPIAVVGIAVVGVVGLAFALMRKS